MYVYIYIYIYIIRYIIRYKIIVGNGWKCSFQVYGPCLV